MDIQIADIKIVSMAGYKSQWKILPEDITIVDDQPFVRLKPFSYGLQQLASEENCLCSNKTPTKYWSLTYSIGYAKLIQLRSDASQDDDDSTGPCLFGPRPAKIPKNKHTPQIKLNQDRAAIRSTTDIIIRVDEQDRYIRILKSVHAQDAFHIMCDAQTIGLVVKFLRDEGFNEHEAKIDLPAGVRLTKSGKYLAFVTNGDGKKKQKTAKTVDEAVAWQCEMQSNGDGFEVPGDDDNADDHDNGEHAHAE